MAAYSETSFSFPKLTRDNFKQWKFNVDLYLISQDLQEFTSDKVPVQKEKVAGTTAVTETEKGKQKEGKALAIICLSISEELKNIVYEAETPYQAWQLLKAVYEPTSRARIAGLRRKLLSIRYEHGESMSSYLNRVVGAAKDLEQAGKQVEEDELVFQIIEHLPESYESLVTQIYRMTDEEFKVKGVRNLLLSEYDRQQDRKLQHEESGPSSQALISTENFKGKKKEERPRLEHRTCYGCGLKGHLIKNCFAQRNKSQRGKAIYKSSKSFKQAHYASAMVSGDQVLEFVLDSAATDHFCFDRSAFVNFKVFRSKAAIASGTTSILGVGDVHLKITSGTVFKTLLLKNVFYAPDMSRNLISVRCLTADNFKVSFALDKASIFSNDNEFLIVPLKQKFYTIFANCINVDVPEAQLINSNNLMTWHSRFGHLNCRALLSFAKSKNVIGLEKLSGSPDQCEICNYSKSHRESFTEIDKIKTSSILELLYIDIWGPSPVPSMGGAKYFLSIIDDFSRYAFVYILKYKNQAFNIFKNFKAMAERQTGRKIKRIRTDNAKELLADYFETYLKTEGIHHEKTDIYSPEMNGTIERYNRTLMEGVRSILIQSKLPKSLWAELVITQNYLRNRFPHKKLNGRAPFNVWRGKSFSVRHLKVIGSDAFVHIPKRYRTKLDKRSKKGILIGYATRTAGYRIWYPGTTKVEETKNVKIVEQNLDFKHWEMKDSGKDEFINFSLRNENLEDNLPVVPLAQTPPSLVKDWKREEITRKTGETAGRVDVYYYPEQGVRLRSQNDAEKYCQEKGITYNKNDFNFRPMSKDIPEETSSNFVKEENPEAHCIEIRIPNSFKDSQNLPEKNNWMEAMQNELDTLKNRGVYDLVPKPENAKIIGTRWVYTLKKDVSGKVKCFKARLVAKGFRQVEGINYFDTFSPVISFSLVRLFYTLLVVLKGWVNQHLDIKGAYLYAKLNELIFVSQPAGFIEKNKENCVWKLNKALYGLHQAGREWFLELDSTFIGLGFQKVKDCNCIYTFKLSVIVLIYVDDLAVFARDNENLKEVIELIKLKFEIKVLGEITHFLGVTFEKKGGEIFINQCDYIDKLSNMFNIPMTKSKLPLTPGIVLNSAIEGEQAIDVPYRELIGCLLFLASRTRPDIQFSVIALAQFSNCPSWTHWKYLCQILQYVFNTRDKAINLSRISNSSLNTYTDASWASDLVDRKSISGYIIFLDNVPIIWSSSKQKCTALSSMEAEYISLSDSIKELTWLIRILDNFTFLNLSIIKPTVYCDNQSAISFSKNSIENCRTKYIDTRKYFVKENLHKFNLKYVSGSVNVADIFTKILPSEKFLYYSKWIFG